MENKETNKNTQTLKKCIDMEIYNTHTHTHTTSKHTQYIIQSWVYIHFNRSII